MKTARVKGQVVAAVAAPGLEGLRIMVVQDIDEQGRDRGHPYAAVDGIRCSGPGDTVYVVGKRDAAIALGDGVPVDATICGFVDEISVDAENIIGERRKGKHQLKKEERQK